MFLLVWFKRLDSDIYGEILLRSVRCFKQNLLKQWTA